MSVGLFVASTSLKGMPNSEVNLARRDFLKMSGVTFHVTWNPNTRAQQLILLATGMDPDESV